MLWKRSCVAGFLQRALLAAPRVAGKHHFAQELACFPLKLQPLSDISLFVFSRVSFVSSVFVKLSAVSLCSGALCPDQVLPGDHHHRIQRLPLLRSALVPDAELVRTLTRLFAVFDKRVHSTASDPHLLLFSFVTDHLRFVL